MTMNSQWGGGGMNPPEPLPMVKSMRDVGYMGGRQITKEYISQKNILFSGAT